MAKKQKIPKLVDMLIDASENYNLHDVSGRAWNPESIKNAYYMAQEEYGNPMQYLNKSNILKEILKSMFRHSTGYDFEEEKEQFKKYEDFLTRAYSGQTEKTPSVRDSLYNIFMEYEDKYDFLNPKGQEVMSDIISRDLYSIPELENLYIEKYAKE
tara:strand:- start:47 stop:514 length:468 start_codon:yes stop_codon:yes gene_type:complete